MKIYRVKIIKNSSIKTLNLWAKNENALKIKLKQKNISPLSISLHPFYKIKKQFFDLSFSFNQMSLLLDSYISIDEVMDYAVKTSPLSFYDEFSKARELLKSGQSLSKSFEVFKLPPLYNILIGIGEKTGKLQDIFALIARDMEQKNSFSKKIKKILFYPLVVFISIVIAFLCGTIFIIPEFEQFFSQSDIPLPFITQSLLWIYENISYFFYFGFLIFLLIVVLHFGIKKSSLLRFYRDKMMFLIPFYQKILLYNKSLHFFQALYFLQISGSDIKMSLDTASLTLDNLYLESKIKRSKIFLQKGERFCDCLKESEIFDEITLGLLDSGEKGGRLDNVFEIISRRYGEMEQHLLDRFMLYIEPVCSIFLALMVLYLALGIFLPIWNLQEIQIF